MGKYAGTTLQGRKVDACLHENQRELQTGVSVRRVECVNLVKLNAMIHRRLSSPEALAHFAKS